MNVIINSICANYCDDKEIGEYAEVSVEAVIDGIKVDSVFTVQLCSGYYEPQNGCWITTDCGDGDFTVAEQIIYDEVDIKGEAEKAAKNYHKENFVYHDTGFNCAINSCSLYAREDLRDGTITLVSIDSSHNPACDYGCGSGENETFDDLEEAMEYLNQFRTGDHQDCRSLYAYFNQDKEI